MIRNATRRFSSRVENYVKYRPGYPAGVLSVLRQRCALTPDSIVADVGSGTGIFSELVLSNGNPVYGVEPNAEMRAAGERWLSAHPKFTSVNGTAEATTLPTRSVDVITAAQAFHWFEQTRTRVEFERILNPGGWVALIWNDRHLDRTPFLRDYEALLQRYATDYDEVRHKELDLAKARGFFGADAVSITRLPNRQEFDFEGLHGRLLSSSYAPEAGHPSYQPMVARLKEIFDRYQTGGIVAFEYDTQIFCAQLLPTYSAE